MGDVNIGILLWTYEYYNDCNKVLRRGQINSSSVPRKNSFPDVSERGGKMSKCFFFFFFFHNSSSSGLLTTTISCPLRKVNWKIKSVSKSVDMVLWERNEVKVLSSGKTEGTMEGVRRKRRTKSVNRRRWTRNGKPRIRRRDVGKNCLVGKGTVVNH